MTRVRASNRAALLGCTLFAALGLGNTAAGAGGDESAPVLLSTTGGGTTWTDAAELIASAKAGNPAARLQYARLLEDGYPPDVSADPARALAIYRELAADNDDEALFRLGKISHDGLLGQPVDRTKAFDLYRRAAALGNATATHNVGAMYVSGRGVKRDYVEGLAWLLLAAERGVDEGSVAAVKQRLKKRPELIAQAAQRLAALKKELEGDDNLAPPAEPTAPRARTELPKLTPLAPPDKIAPAITVPKISIPAPHPIAVPPPSSGGTG